VTIILGQTDTLCELCASTICVIDIVRALNSIGRACQILNSGSTLINVTIDALLADLSPTIHAVC
jgi:hypothetical protein